MATVPVAPSPTTAPKAPQPVQTLNRLLESPEVAKQIARACARHLNPEQVVRVALTACQRSPALLECDPMSILGCVIQASELGLLLNGVLGQAYMVPYRNKKAGGRKEAQFQVGYRGLVQMAHRSGQVKSFYSQIVHENDQFDYQYGTDSYLHHIPARKDRGKIVAVYSVLNLLTGGGDFEVMSYEEIEEHRQKYSKDTREDSCWNTSWEEMAKKTPLRRLAKRAPVSVELVHAAVLDEYAEAGVATVDRDLPTALATADRQQLLRDRLAAARQATAALEAPVADLPADTPPPQPEGA